MLSPFIQKDRQDGGTPTSEMPSWNVGRISEENPYLMQIWRHSDRNKAQFPTLSFLNELGCQKIVAWYYSLLVISLLQREGSPGNAATGHHGNVAALQSYSQHLRKLIPPPHLTRCLLLCLHSHRHGAPGRWSKELRFQQALHIENESPLPHSLFCKILWP